MIERLSQWNYVLQLKSAVLWTPVLDLVSLSELEILRKTKTYQLLSYFDLWHDTNP